MTSKSLWMDIEVAPDAQVLDGVHECDVAVIGSGIAGISTAYELSKRGKSVIVIDRGRICGGMTSRTSAHLAPLCDDLVSEMTKIKGKEATKLFCDSQAAAVDPSRKSRRSRRSIATSGGSTAISFRARTCRRMLLTRRWTRSARSEPPSTG
jgi:glycine/D-amino acid oxidase-like deaminating enzyme